MLYFPTSLTLVLINNLVIIYLPLSIPPQELKTEEEKVTTLARYYDLFTSKLI